MGGGVDGGCGRGGRARRPEIQNPMSDIKMKLSAVILYFKISPREGGG